MRESRLKQVEVLCRWMSVIGALMLTVGIVMGIVGGQWAIASALFGGTLVLLPNGILGIFRTRAAIRRVQSTYGNSNSERSDVNKHSSPLFSLLHIMAVMAAVGGLLMVGGMVLGLRFHRWADMGVLLAAGGPMVGVAIWEHRRLSHNLDRYGMGAGRTGSPRGDSDEAPDNTFDNTSSG